MNWGDTEVKSIVYTLCNMDTHECTDPVTLNFDTPLAINEVRKINIPIPVGTSLGKVDLMLHVKEVNGDYNEYSSPITYITRCMVNKVPHKRVLIEDYTALWCQWCPVGMVATEALVREHPDDVVAISIHKGDELATTTAYQMVCFLIMQSICLPYGVHVKIRLLAMMVQVCMRARKTT